MVHGERVRSAPALWLHLGSDPPHAGRHPPFDLGYGSRLRAGRTRNAHTSHFDRLGNAHAHTLGRRLSRDGRSPMSEPPHMRTPMRRVRGLGAAHSGTGHFWHQRVTSVAGIPLTIGLLLIITALLGRNHAAVVQILASPIVSIIVLLFITANEDHSWHGGVDGCAGSGLRAVVGCREAGLRTARTTKVIPTRSHTVAAQG